MKIVYAKEDFPERFKESLFLVGPTPRSHNPVPSWRPKALDLLESLGYEGTVFIPEDRGGEFQGTYDEQVGWEIEALNMSDIIVAWVPRDLETMPAFTTNVEFGYWLKSGKLIYGRPDNSPKTRYLDSLYRMETGEEACSTLKETLEKTHSFCFIRSSLET